MGCLILFLLFAVAFCASIAKDAEYCKNYPGDIAFSYATTEDEYYWFQNYKNAYTTKKGNEAYAIYRRRTIITRHPRPHGARPNSINQFNNMNNANVFQQQIQQQQVVGPFPPPEVNQEEQHGNESEEAEEIKPALPIWKITIPRQCSRAIIARIENAQVAEYFELNNTHFQDPNITTSSSSSVSRQSVASSGTPSVATRTIDITDQSMIADAWYVICIDVNIVQKGQPHVCNHCTLLKAKKDGGRQQFFDFDWMPGSFINTSAELRYSAVDMPFPWATVRSKVWNRYANPRCHGTAEHVVFESKDFVYPDHFTYMTVQNLVGKMSYGVQVDLEFPWKQEPNGILPKPFALHDYLHNDQTTTLAKCEDYNYQGD